MSQVCFLLLIQLVLLSRDASVALFPSAGIEHEGSRWSLGSIRSTATDREPVRPTRSDERADNWSACHMVPSGA
jgi:hypothetical protein